MSDRARFRCKASAIRLGLFAFALFLIPLLASCTGEQEGPKIYEEEKVLMGTVFSIKAADSTHTATEVEEAFKEAFREIAHLESEMSEWIPDTPVSLASKLAGKKPVRITEDLQNVAALSLEISASTGGIFDCTFLPLGRLWDVKHRRTPPPADSVRAARRLVDWRAVELDPLKKTLYLQRQGMQIGFGGVAKGYAARQAGRALEERGITNYIINAGGDLYVSGMKAERPWTSGIADPRHKDQPPVMAFAVSRNCGIATSGDYENFFTFEGKRYHHIIDLRTGWPACGMQSSTVFAEDPAKADAYATAFFIMGPEASARVVAKDSSIAFVLIDSSGVLHESVNLRRFITPMD